MSDHSQHPTTRKLKLLDQVRLAILTTNYSIRKDKLYKPDLVGVIIMNR
jgi:hypothetical protein